jgi:hypothetical protein
MQSQQACSMSQQALSPLVQVMQTPSLVMVHLQVHIIHWQTTMPFIMQQHEHMPSASILHRFCRAPQETSSSQTQVIFMPPVHFSILIVQRGTIDMAPMLGPMAGMPVMGMVPVGIEPIIMGRSIIIVGCIAKSFAREGPSAVADSASNAALNPRLQIFWWAWGTIKKMFVPPEDGWAIVQPPNYTQRQSLRKCLSRNAL